jgi:hypothetical protein
MLAKCPPHMAPDFRHCVKPVMHAPEFRDSPTEIAATYLQNFLLAGALKFR